MRTESVLKQGSIRTGNTVQGEIDAPHPGAQSGNISQRRPPEGGGGRKAFLGGRGIGQKGKEEPFTWPGAEEGFVCPVFNLLLSSPAFR